MVPTFQSTHLFTTGSNPVKIRCYVLVTWRLLFNCRVPFFLHGSCPLLDVLLHYCHFLQTYTVTEYPVAERYIMDRAVHR